MTTQAIESVRTITVTMNKAKETKNTVMYADDTEGTHVPTLYIRKEAFADAAEYPYSIMVQVSF